MLELIQHPCNGWTCLPAGFQAQLPPTTGQRKHPISADMVATARTDCTVSNVPCSGVSCSWGVQQTFMQLYKVQGVSSEIRQGQKKQITAVHPFNYTAWRIQRYQHSLLAKTGSIRIPIEDTGQPVSLVLGAVAALAWPASHVVGYAVEVPPTGAVPGGQMKPLQQERLPPTKSQT